MDIGFTAANALTLVHLLNPILVILATYLVSRVDMRTEYKIAIGFAASAILATLTAYGTGTLQANFWDNLFYIYGTAQGIYAAVFKFGGLERLIYAREALASQVAQDAKEQVAVLTNAEAKEVLDPSTSKTVDVEVTTTNVTTVEKILTKSLLDIEEQGCYDSSKSEITRG